MRSWMPILVVAAMAVLGIFTYAIVLNADLPPAHAVCKHCPVCPTTNLKDVPDLPVTPQQARLPGMELRLQECKPQPVDAFDPFKLELLLSTSMSSTEPGNFELFDGGTGPRAAQEGQPRLRKRALFAIACGASSRPLLDVLVRKAGLTDFQFILFIYDDSDWSDLDWFQHIVSVRVRHQVKFWFYKRFLHPDIVDAYDYIFLSDDDVNFEQINVAGFFDLMDTYRIDLAQPSRSRMTPGTNYPLLVERPSPEGGRWSSFVEVMAPVFSRRAWRQCIYEMLQPDLVSGWGYDLQWYCVCRSRGVGRAAYIDRYPLLHQPPPGRSSLSRDADERAGMEWGLVEGLVREFNPLCGRQMDNEHRPINAGDAGKCDLF
eukprot:TRINITY_DN13313_c0_g1_i1.p1 TRINITY_DN13313_c0_g1~~TRINITY_DN13313_c0_g1_i1.p1  ORF type:complete len:374 (+),score=47.46 TRINITY_DN13313_c0_g1_i1:87-1208(+)